VPLVRLAEDVVRAQALMLQNLEKVRNLYSSGTISKQEHDKLIQKFLKD